MEVAIRVLDRREVPGFRPYLLPDTAAQLERGAEDVLALGAVTGRSACGAIAVRLTERGAELTDLFVDAAVRRRGVGRFLLRNLIWGLERLGVDLLWADYVLRGEELTAMDALLTGEGFDEPRVRSRVYLAPTELFQDVPRVGPAFSPKYRTPANVLPFSQLTGEALAELAADDGIPDMLTWESLKRRAVSDLSVALVEDGRVLAYHLGGESADGGYVLLAAVRREGAPISAFFTLLLEQLNRCYYRAGGYFPFYFSTLSPRVERLALRLMGDRYIRYEEHVRVRTLEPQAELLEQEESL